MADSGSEGGSSDPGSGEAAQPPSPQQSLQPPRIVFDTGVVLQATLNLDGPAARALLLMDTGGARVYVSNRLRAEYEETLSNPDVRARFERLTDERMEAVLGRFDALAARLPNPPRRVAYPRDPDDEPPLNLAVHVQAHYLVTRDRDLLDLAGDRRFGRLSPGIRILDPVSLLQEIVPPRREPPRPTLAHEQSTESPPAEQQREPEQQRTRDIPRGR